MNKPKKIILIVDDSPLIITRLQGMLQKLEEKLVILAAENYSQAIQIAKKEEVSIAILDINLGEESGIKLLKAIKKHNPGTVVIMLTNQNNQQYENISKQLGAAWFLDKSKDFAQIPEIISLII